MYKKKTLKNKSNRKSVRRKSVRRKSVRRKSVRRKSVRKRNLNKMKGGIGPELDNLTGLEYHKISENIKNNPDIIIRCKNMANFCQTNRDIKKLCENSKLPMKEVIDSCKVYAKNVKDAVNIVKEDGSKLDSFPELIDNKKVVLAAVRNNGYALQYASERLKDDNEVVLAAIGNGKFEEWKGSTGAWVEHDVFEYASDRLKDDKEVVLAAVKKEGSLQAASDRLKDDTEVVLAAVNKEGYGNSLAYASDRLKDDKNVVLTAVRNNGYALAFASDRLKNDTEVIFAAFRNNPKSKDYAIKNSFGF